jgi:hypothetical protein
VLLFKKSSFLYKHLVDYYTNTMSTTLATNIEQSVSAQQLTTTDTEQALYHLHHQYQEQQQQQQQHEQLQLQDPSAIIHAPTATAESPSHQQTSLSSPISAADSNGANSVKDGKRNGHGRMLF